MSAAVPIGTRPIDSFGNLLDGCAFRDETALDVNVRNVQLRLPRSAIAHFESTRDRRRPELCAIAALEGSKPFTPMSYLARRQRRCRRCWSPSGGWTVIGEWIVSQTMIVERGKPRTDIEDMRRFGEADRADSFVVGEGRKRPRWRT